MEPPWKAYNVMRKMDYPYEVSISSSIGYLYYLEHFYDALTLKLDMLLPNIMLLVLQLFQHIVDSMKDPSIAAFWLFTLPQIMGGFDYDDDVKKRIWWQYQVILLSTGFFSYYIHVVLAKPMKLHILNKCGSIQMYK